MKKLFEMTTQSDTNLENNLNRPTRDNNPERDERERDEYLVRRGKIQTAVTSAVAIPASTAASGAAMGPLCFGTSVAKSAAMGAAFGCAGSFCFATSVLCCLFAPKIISAATRRQLASNEITSYDQVQTYSDDLSPSNK